MDKNDEPIKVDEVEESQDMNPKQVLNILFKKAKQISKSSTCSQSKHYYIIVLTGTILAKQNLKGLTSLEA